MAFIIKEDPERAAQIAYKKALELRRREIAARGDKIDFLRAYANWLTSQPTPVSILYRHDVRTHEAVAAGVLHRSFLGREILPISPPISPIPPNNSHVVDWATGFVPMKPAKRAQPAERRPPAMSPSIYANLFKC